MNTERVTSADGTSLAFERQGSGPPLILVGGAFCDRTARASGTPLAALLSPEFTVFSYDRRGRGDSTDTADWSLAHEIEDMAALIRAAGGSAFVYGISSGAVLALAAAVHELPISKLALYEPPIVLDARRAAPLRDVARELEAHTAAARRAEAAELFLTQVVQVPVPVVAQMKQAPLWPSLEALAHTLSYDVRITTLASELIARASSVRAPTLAIYGELCPLWMRDGIRALSDALPTADQRMLAGQTHDVDPRALASVLREFFGA